MLPRPSFTHVPGTQDRYEVSNYDDISPTESITLQYLGQARALCHALAEKYDKTYYAYPLVGYWCVTPRNPLVSCVHIPPSVPLSK